MLDGKTVMITGAAHRIGRHLAITAARAGADVILHYARSAAAVQETAQAVRSLGRQAWVLQADFSRTEEVEHLVDAAWQLHPVDHLVNNASLFAPLQITDTTLEDWQQHLNINLTAPFLLSQAFARNTAPQAGRIINILDWRALRPGADHLPYTISKAGLAALTLSLAVALAPRIQVNGLALGAILPPSDGAPHDKILESVPARRWASLDEVGQALLFLLGGPTYITGEIIHVDGGRHLT